MQPGLITRPPTAIAEQPADPSLFLPFEWESTRLVTPQEMLAMTAIVWFCDQLPAITDLSFDHPACQFLWLLGGEGAGLATLAFPNLKQIRRDSDFLNGCSFSLSIAAISSLTTLRLPLLSTIDRGFCIINCPSLATFDLPVLRELHGDFIAPRCALTVETVNAILQMLVAANDGTWSFNVDLSGETNAAPEGDGLVAAELLLTRGATVTTN